MVVEEVDAEAQVVVRIEAVGELLGELGEEAVEGSALVGLVVPFEP